MTLAHVQTRPASLPAAFTNELRALLGERFSEALAVREQHGGGGMHLANLPPQAVASPQTVNEVVAIVRACARERIPLIPYGAGTSLECHVGARHGGVSIDMSGMQRIVRVDVEDQDCIVEAGVTRESLNAYLRDTGLFFPVDPGANATLAGMAATRASGTTTLRYGGMRENVLGLTIVTADARLIRTARRARKSSAGYDLTRLLIGSEGTLGVIVDLTLRLSATPEAVSTARCAFPSTEAAVRTVIDLVQLGVPLARAELLDDVQMTAINRLFGLDYAEADTLFLEFHGRADEVAAQARRAAAVAREHEGGAFQWATETEERNRMWRARHQAGPAAVALRPGARPWSTDVCVPVSRLAECIRETKRDLANAPFPAVVLGHVGDGNFHVIMLTQPDAPEELRAAENINRRLVARAIDMDGTCTGEHGVGLGKQEAVRAELGAAVDLMADIKRAMDPHHILNPGKIFAI